LCTPTERTEGRTVGEAVGEVPIASFAAGVSEYTPFGAKGTGVAAAAGVGAGMGVSSALISVDGKRRTNAQKLIKNNKRRFKRGCSCS
jgi:hypothetical protein